MRRLFAVSTTVLTLATVAQFFTAAKTVDRSSSAESPVGDVVFGFHALNALLIIAVLQAVSRQAWHLAIRGPGVDAQSSRPAADPLR